MKVYLARHGETEWSLSEQHTSRTDIPLTDNGRRQAAELRGLFASRPVEKVLTSPLSRAVESATLAGFVDAQATDELLEFDYGEYEGVTTVDIRQERPDWYLWRDGSPGGETPADVAARVGHLIDRLRSDGVDAVLFSHGLGRLRQRPAVLDNATHHHRPAFRPELGVSVELHPESSLGLGGLTPPASKEARMNNVLRNYS